MSYCIDTSALLDGWIRYYPADVVPGLWERLEDLISQGELISSEEVLDELSRKDDEVYAWAKKNESMFIRTDERIQKQVAIVLSQHPRIIDTRRNRSGADPFVISVALLKDSTLVTGENKSTSLTRPKIPDVCDALNIPWKNLVQLCRDQGWQFR